MFRIQTQQIKNEDGFTTAKTFVLFGVPIFRIYYDMILG